MALPTASCRFKRAGTWLAPTGPPSCRRASGFGAAVSSSGPLLCAELTRLVSGPPPSRRQPSVVGPVRDRSRARNRPTDQEPRQCRASDRTAAVRGTVALCRCRRSEDEGELLHDANLRRRGRRPAPRGLRPCGARRRGVRLARSAHLLCRCERQLPRR